MRRWWRSWRASTPPRSAGPRASLRHVSSATAAVVGAQAIDLRALLPALREPTAAAAPGGPAVASAAASPAPAVAAASALSVGMPARVAPAFPAPWPGQTPLESLTFGVFGEHLDTTFRARAVVGAVDLLLTHATPCPHQPEGPPRSFSLLFRG